MATQSSTTVGVNVRKAMSMEGISQRQLAKILDISQPSICRRLSGEKDFQVSELLKVAEYLCQPIGDFIPQSSPAVQLTPQAEPAGDSFLTEGAA